MSSEKNIVETTVDLTRQCLVVDVEGRKYSALNLSPVFDTRKFPSIGLCTLTGLAGYLNAGMDKTTATPRMIVIDNYDRVSVFDDVHEITLRRELIIQTNLKKSGNKFRFNEYMPHEEFIIGLQSMFLDTYQCENLIKYVSKLTINNTIDVQDDGTTQSAVIKKGMSGALKENAAAPSIIKLSPYRTFIEVQQPSSDFIFRMKAIEGKVPVCALFEADGGAWENAAMANIAEWLKDKVTIPVIY